MVSLSPEHANASPSDRKPFLSSPHAERALLQAGGTTPFDHKSISQSAASMFPIHTRPSRHLK
uniref:Uncharacterized protein n=1 Tax=Anguilla anguilla TaxID=7936 RepID=A0A0E9PHX6_ANGAN